MRLVDSAGDMAPEIRDCPPWARAVCYQLHMYGNRPGRMPAIIRWLTRMYGSGMDSDGDGDRQQD
jgi:hypothetical protein